MVDIASLKHANSVRWAAMHVDPHYVPILEKIAGRLLSAEERYRTVARTGVPWWIIAVIHQRESSQSWLASLAQGDPWNKKSIHVPKGRGPFHSWEDAAMDALINCPPYAAKWKDWTPGGALTLLEKYNGLGYAMRGKPSPYVWASTDQYKKGKYTSDGHYDPNAIDHQLGCAALISVMAQHNKDVKFES